MQDIEQAAATPAAEETPAPAKPLYRLKLDHDDVYWGADEAVAELVAEGDVTLDHVPDNPPGRYKWNRELACLQALPASQVKFAPEAPTLEQAFHHLVTSLEEAGHALPPAVSAWVVEFKKTIER